jgi:DNA transformation protein
MGPRQRRSFPELEPRPVDTTSQWLTERLTALGNVRAQRMFGGAGIFVEDVMFGIVHKSCAYLKVDEETQARYVELGSRPFRPNARQTLRTFYEVPEPVLGDDAELLAWAKEALDVAQRAAERRATANEPCSPEDILAGHRDGVRALTERLRRLVLREVPNAEEAGHAGWKLIAYRAPRYFCFIAPMRDHVRLGFERGIDLRDPDGLLEGTGTQVRFVRLEEHIPPPEGPLRALIRQAADKARARRSKAQRKGR